MTRLSSADLRRLHRGDPTLLTHLFLQHSPSLLLWARGYATTEDQAEDLVQEVWAKVWRTRTRYSGTGSFRGWLYRLARGVFVDEVRSARSRSRREREYGALAGADSVPPPGLSERHPELFRALGTLTSRQRDVVLLRVVEGLSTREVADTLDCAEGTVKATLSQAMAKMRSIGRGSRETRMEEYD